VPAGVGVTSIGAISRQSIRQLTDPAFPDPAFPDLAALGMLGHPSLAESALRAGRHAALGAIGLHPRLGIADLPAPDALDD